MRREERVTVQGPVKKPPPDGMSHRGCPPPLFQCIPPPPLSPCGALHPVLCALCCLPAVGPRQGWGNFAGGGWGGVIRAVWGGWGGLRNLSHSTCSASAIARRKETECQLDTVFSVGPQLIQWLVTAEPKGADGTTDEDFLVLTCACSVCGDQDLRIQISGENEVFNFFQKNKRNSKQKNEKESDSKSKK